MRVGLLSAIEAISDAGGDPRAFLPVAGRPVIQHQLECALAMGCEKIACHAIGLPRELVALQHLAERSGAQFQIINNGRALSGIVKAADELLVIADGLLADQALAVSALRDHPSILVFPAEEGLAAGYERIDRDHAWAGMFMVRGPAVERLADLPPDADPVSGLLRIALQSGVAIKQMPKGVLSGQDWGVVQSDEKAHRFEQSWLERHAKAAPFYAPLLALADRGAIALAARPGGRTPGSAALYAAAAGTAALALGASHFWQPVAGLAIGAAAFVIARVAGTVSSVSAIGRSGPQSPGRMAGVIAVALDLMLLGLIWLATPLAGRIETILSAAILLAVLRLGSVLPGRKWKILLEDRALLAAALAVAVVLSQLMTCIQIITLIFLISILVDSVRAQLTRT